MPTLAEQADRAAAGLHAHWRTQCAYIAGGEIDEAYGLLVTATNLPDETLNVAFAPGAVDEPDKAYEWVTDWFAARGLRTGVELRSGRTEALADVLGRHGFTVVVRRPAMTLHPVPTPPAHEPRIHVARVESDADLAAFQAIQGAIFDLTPEVAERFVPRAATETAGIAFFVGRYDDVVCATSAATVSAHGVGVVGVATLPAYRHRGLGRAVTSAAVAYGGADLAWLYPSATARRMYERLGFRAVGDSEVWVEPR